MDAAWLSALVFFVIVVMIIGVVFILGSYQEEEAAYFKRMISGLNDHAHALRGLESRFQMFNQIHLEHQKKQTEFETNLRISVGAMDDAIFRLQDRVGLIDANLERLRQMMVVEKSKKILSSVNKPIQKNKNQKKKIAKKR